MSQVPQWIFFNLIKKKSRASNIFINLMKVEKIIHLSNFDKSNLLEICFNSYFLGLYLRKKNTS